MIRGVRESEPSQDPERMSNPYGQTPLPPQEPWLGQNLGSSHQSQYSSSAPHQQASQQHGSHQPDSQQQASHQQGSQQQGWQPQGPPAQSPWPPLPGTKQSNGLAITALVVAVFALLLGLGSFFSGLLGAMAFGGFSSGFPAGMDGMGESLGTAPQVVSGQPYPGKLLQDEVTRVASHDFGEVTSMSCPATPAVVADAVTECSGTVDGSPWRFKVTFQDGLGHFTLVEKVS